MSNSSVVELVAVLLDGDSLVVFLFDAEHVTAVVKQTNKKFANVDGRNETDLNSIGAVFIFFC